MATPQDWISWFLGINAIQVNGVAVPGSPGERILNILCAGASAADNPGNGSTDLTIPSVSTVPQYAVVQVIHGTTTATPNKIHEVDNSGGAVVLNVPSGGATGAWIGVKLACTPGSGGSLITVNAPAGKQIEIPLGVDGAQSGYTFASAVTFSDAALKGNGFQWYLQASGNYALYPN